ncbi:MAG: hypothetical protein J6V99_08980 [Neisseriaceae bacterium]|nr:hypothetical protein [Neisseriaceae bacterium]
MYSFTEKIFSLPVTVMEFQSKSNHFKKWMICNKNTTGIYQVSINDVNRILSIKKTIFHHKIICYSMKIGYF